MQYSSIGNGASHRRRIPARITGASLAQLLRNMGPAARAVLAANIIDGDVVITALTRRMVAMLCGASASYVDAALHHGAEEREAIARGDRPLVPRARTRADARPINWANLDDDALVEAVRRAGVERGLNGAVAAETIA